MSTPESFSFEAIINASYGEAATEVKPVGDLQKEHVIFTPGAPVSERFTKSYSSLYSHRYKKDFGYFVLHSCTEISDEFELNPEWVPSDEDEAEE